MWIYLSLCVGLGRNNGLFHRTPANRLKHACISQVTRLSGTVIDSFTNRLLLRSLKRGCSLEMKWTHMGQYKWNLSCDILKCLFLIALSLCLFCKCSGVRSNRCGGGLKLHWVHWVFIHGASNWIFIIIRWRDGYNWVFRFSDHTASEALRDMQMFPLNILHYLDCFLSELPSNKTSCTTCRQSMSFSHWLWKGRPFWRVEWRQSVARAVNVLYTSQQSLILTYSWRNSLY